MQPGFPYPFHVCDALKKYKAWGVENLLEFGGAVPAHNSINALTMQAFEQDPDQNPVEFLKNLSAKQFGAGAGALMYSAWEEIKNAMDVWNGYETHPLSGSQPYLGMCTFVELPDAILPGVEKTFEWNLDIRTIVEPWRASEYQRFREKQLLTDMRKMGAYLSKAEKLAAKAVKLADSNEQIGICHYSGSLEGVGRPTCKEYAERNHAAIAIANALCKQRVNILKAIHFLKEKKEAEHLKLVREDIALQESFIKLLAKFYEKRPCLVRVGVTQRELEDYIVGTKAKIKKLKAYLAEK